MGRGEAPGHFISPGVQHSPTAEIASDQLEKIQFHFRRPFLRYTNYDTWFMGSIQAYPPLVKREIVFSEDFWKFPAGIGHAGGE